MFQGCNAEIGKSCQLCLSSIQDEILPRASMVCIALGLTGVASFIRLFGNERVVYWREASGLPKRHSVAYFFAKDVSVWPQLLCVHAPVSVFDA